MEIATSLVSPAAQADKPDRTQMGIMFVLFHAYVRFWQRSDLTHIVHVDVVPNDVSYTRHAQTCDTTPAGQPTSHIIAHLRIP